MTEKQIKWHQRAFALVRIKGFAGINESVLTKEEITMLHAMYTLRDKFVSDFSKHSKELGFNVKDNE